jgi:hypothetical protein
MHSLFGDFCVYTFEISKGHIHVWMSIKISWIALNKYIELYFYVPAVTHFVLYIEYNRLATR